jgi:oligosaccharide repeat unit polymerase
MAVEAKVDMEMQHVIVWTFLVFLTFFILVLMQFGIVSTSDLKYLWFSLYGSSFLLIVDKLRKGLFFEPIVIVPSAYLLLLVIGSILFELIRERDYNVYLSNYIGIGYLGLLIGISLTQYFRYTITICRTEKVLFEHRPMRNRMLSYCIILISIMASISLFAKSGIPMASADVNQSRIALTAGSGYLNIFMIGLAVWPMAVLYDSIARKSKTGLIISHIFAGVVFMIILMTGYRSRTMTFLAEYVGIYFFFNRRRFSLKLIIICALVSMTFLSFVGAYRRGTDDFASIAQEAGNIVASRPVMFELIVNRFSESKFFYGTRYFADLVKLLPGSQESVNVDLKYEVFPNPDKMPEEAGVTPSIIGEAYMNFGGLGIFWVMLFVGIILGFSYKLMARKPTYLRCAFYFTFVFTMAGCVASGIGILLMQIIYLWCWVLISNFLYEWRLKIWDDKPS